MTSTSSCRLLNATTGLLSITPSVLLTTAKSAAIAYQHVNFDPNTNVRLAACEALYRMRVDYRLKEAQVHSLPIQTDPNVQVTLIDMLVTLRVHRAVPQFERLAKCPDALPVVRAQAEESIGKLL